MYPSGRGAGKGSFIRWWRLLWLLLLRGLLLLGHGDGRVSNCCRDDVGRRLDLYHRGVMMDGDWDFGSALYGLIHKAAAAVHALHKRSRERWEMEKTPLETRDRDLPAQLHFRPAANK